MYLLAGADLDRLTVLGLRAPAQFPIVFSWAAIVALIWFWWRYQIAWINSSSRLTYRNRYLQELHQRQPFKKLVNRTIDHKEIWDKGFAGRSKDDFRILKLIGYSEVTHAKVLRRSICVSALTYNIGPTNYDIGTNHFPDKKYLEVPVPLILHCVYSLLFFLRSELRRDDFADQRLPHMVFAIAVILIAAKMLGFDPAGLFGLMSIADSPPDS